MRQQKQQPQPGHDRRAGAPTPAFAQDAEQHITALQQAAARLLDSALGRSPRGATDLATELDIDTKLAWKAVRLTSNADPFAAARFIPGDAAIARIAEAAIQNGAQHARAKQLLDASAKLHEFIHTRAGSRKNFELLATGIAGRRSDRDDRETRRAGFHAASLAHGLQADAEVVCAILTPTHDDHQRFDVSVINGVLGLQQLRPGARWRMGRPHRRLKSLTLGEGSAEWHPIDQQPHHDDDDNDDQAENQAPPVLRALSSKPLPRHEARLLDDGQVIYELEPADIGRAARVDCFTGVTLKRAGFRDRLPDEPASRVFNSMVHARVPSERLLTIYAVHNTLFDQRPPAANLFNTAHATGHATVEDFDRIPLEVSPEPVSNPDDPAPNTWPNAAMALEILLNEAGETAPSYKLWRATVEFPPIPSALRLTWPRRATTTD